MISLHVYITPKVGRATELNKAVHDGWFAAMAEQPGFLSAAVLAPYSDDELAALGASKPGSAMEAVAFWDTEAQRAAWAERPIHDRVFNPVIDAAESLSYTLQTVEHSRNI